jgi:hypothetical protein
MVVTSGMSPSVSDALPLASSHVMLIILPGCDSSTGCLLHEPLNLMDGSLYGIVTCRGVCVWLIRRVFVWMIGFYWHLITPLGTTGSYSAIADQHILQFTVTHALGFSVFTTRILATDLLQSHCNFKSYMKSYYHGLILSCHYSATADSEDPTLGRLASRNSTRFDSTLFSAATASQSQNHVTTDGQPASLSWNKAPIWGLRPDLVYCLTVAGLLSWGALSDERTGLSFAIATGPRQRSHFWVRVP